MQGEYLREREAESTSQGSSGEEESASAWVSACTLILTHQLGDYLGLPLSVQIVSCKSSHCHEQRRMLALL